MTDTPSQNAATPATRRFPATCTIHSPALGGVRVTAATADLLRTLGDYPGPLLVVEDGKTFRALTWEPWSPYIGRTKAEIVLDEKGWLITFQPDASPREYPPAASLEEAVAHYAREHPAKATPGSATLGRVRRSITLDLWTQPSRIAHTYADACRLLAELERRCLADGTLLYLPGFHAPYDARMPIWEPAEALGGHAGFRELIERSKAVGTIVMPHANFWGYDPTTGLLENWQEAWSGGQWTLGRVIKYMDVGHPRWIALFDRYFDRLVAEFGLEAVFLDQCGNLFDRKACPEIPPGVDLLAGTRHLFERIHGKFPKLLLGAEVLNEAIVDQVTLFQAMWVMEAMIGHFSPILRLMFADRVRFVPHLFLTAAVPCRYVYPHIHTTLIVEHGLEQAFRWYQEYNRAMGGIPSVRLDYNRHGLDPASLQVLEGA